MAFRPQKLNDGSLNYDHAGQADHPSASYGLGWFVAADSTGNTVVYHGGYNPGASTMLYRDPKRQRTILFFDNTHNEHLARVRPTFIRRMSFKKPIPCVEALRQENMMISLSRPWKASVALNSIFE